MNNAVATPQRIAAIFAFLFFGIVPIQAGYAQAASAGILIPADKRHKGISRFDALPFTDRKLGDPDRYRAVNPQFVQRENGHYYFLLRAQPNTPYFDDNLTQKGVLPDGVDAPTELTQTKEAKSATGEISRYVMVKNRGYVLRSRLTPAAEIRTGKWFSFPVKPGSHQLYDGTGIVRGTLAAQTMRLNYGQQKQINGEACYYAFSTTITLAGTNQKSGASGWIKASALQNGCDPGYSAEIVAKMQPPPTPSGDTFTAYTITGGNQTETAGPLSSDGKPAYKFGYADASGTFVPYKVLPGVTLSGRSSIASTDYLKRNDDVINLGFNAAGVSNDTYRVIGANRPLRFYRSLDKAATVLIELFYPKTAERDGLKPVGTMTFVYGYVDEKTNKRWGWIPLDALKSD